MPDTKLIYPIDLYETLMGSIYDSKSDKNIIEAQEDIDFVRFIPYRKKAPLDNFIGDISKKNILTSLREGSANLASISNSAMKSLDSFADPVKVNGTEINIFLPLKSSFLEIDNQHTWGLEEEFAGKALQEGASAVNKLLQGNYGGAIASGVDAAITSGIASALNKFKGPLAQLGTSVYDPKIQSYSDSPPISLNMSWTLVPKNESEANTIKKICNVFNFLSLPEGKSATGDVSVYARKLPSLWKIEFNNTGMMKDFIKRGNSFNCVCTSVKIKYGESNFWSDFKDGFPNQISLTLSFQEYANIRDAQTRTAFETVDEIFKTKQKEPKAETVENADPNLA